MITTIDFDTIFPIWNNDLWPTRKSEITPTSAMCYLGGYDTDNMIGPAIFYAYMYKDQIAGVNSLHLCIDGGYRSRGLYVYPEYRNQGIGLRLLSTCINYAQSKDSLYIWSYPKQSSWKTYQKAGFKLSSPWEISELGFNAYCKLEL